MKAERNTCQRPGCTEPVYVQRRHLCRACYRLARREGLEPLPPRTCREPGCTEAVHALDLCSRHYQREYKRRKESAA